MTSSPRTTRTQPEPDPDFEALLEHLRVHRGADFTGYKRTSLMRLVGRRMQTTGHTSVRDYLDHLEVDPGEFAQLFDMLLINVTSFFRDAEAWTVLREQALPALLLALPAGSPVRVWSAACASGEEAYTLAILLAEVLGPEQFAARVKVYATDIDESALATARAGQYRREALSAVDPMLVERWFEGSGDLLTISSQLRGSVIFGRHDLIQDAPIGRINLLTCRNALMYLNHETQARALERFSFSLAPGGLLMLGKAEMLLTHGDLFSPVDLKHRLFAKRDVRIELRPTFSPRGRDGEVGLTKVVEAAFAGAPDPQLVLDDQGVLSLVNESAVRRLGVSRQDIGRPFFELPVSYSPLELGRPVAAAQSGAAPVELGEVTVGSGADEAWYDVQVAALTAGDGVLGVQITFVDVTRYRHLAQDLDAANRALETAYEELQSSNEELETTNEELQSAIEELETTNEELQSTNEELETMNEELQSTNEEMQAVNDELRERTSEVHRVNAFLESILLGLDGAVVVVDTDLVVRVWNERAEQMWGLRSYEAQGQPFLSLDIGLPVSTLRDALLAVLSGDQHHVDAQVRARDRFGRDVVCAVSCSRLQDAAGAVTGAMVLLEERRP
jgi:two-component system CheB/CheR fusion protein